MDADGARQPAPGPLYEQEVEVRKPLMRRLALPCRPVFLANHAAMMRGGRRGLAAYLRTEFEGNPRGPVWFSAFPGD